MIDELGSYAELDMRPYIRSYVVGPITNGTERAAARIRLALANVLHPDGKPWAKSCCGDKDMVLGETINCAVTDGRLRKNDGVYASRPFPCVHRTDGGYIRICAGWHACYGKQYAESKP